MDEDLLDRLLGLEEDYYQEGYDLGQADGAHAGFVEGRLFGIEKGYEKAMDLGRMHGKALVWDCRLKAPVQDGPLTHPSVKISLVDLVEGFKSMRPLMESSRLSNHIDQLLASTAQDNISAGNDDDSVADFDDRLKKSAAKIKIVSRIIGETEKPIARDTGSGQNRSQDASNIEDLNSLSARR